MLPRAACPPIKRQKLNNIQIIPNRNRPFLQTKKGKPDVKKRLQEHQTHTSGYKLAQLQCKHTEDIISVFFFQHKKCF